MGARIKKFLFAFCSALGSFALCFCLLTALAWGKVIDPPPDYLWMVLLSAALCAVIGGAIDWLSSGSEPLFFGFWAYWVVAGCVSLMWWTLIHEYWSGSSGLGLATAVLLISMAWPPLILGVIWRERTEVKT